MAATRRRPATPLDEELFGEPYRFGFFQAVRLLERLHPGAVPVGRAGPAGREVVRFRSWQSLAFPPSELRELRAESEPGRPPVLTVAFLGLTGPLGVLPHSYGELILERARAGDHTTAAFFDLFNHRMISLFYRAWAKYRPFLAYERGEGDQAARHLFDLIGLGLEPVRNRNAFPDVALLYYAGFFARRPRPAVGLERLLAEYFGMPVEVRQFQGRWLRLDPDDRSRLGAGGINNGLGTSLLLGAKVWDEQGQFRLRVGPLDYGRFLAFSPDGEAFRVLVQLTRQYVDTELDFDVQLILAAAEVPACRLDRKAPARPRLGRNAWLKSREFERDAEEAVFAAGV